MVEGALGAVTFELRWQAEDESWCEPASATWQRPLEQRVERQIVGHWEAVVRIGRIILPWSCQVPVHDAHVNGT